MREFTAYEVRQVPMSGRIHTGEGEFLGTVLVEHGCVTGGAGGGEEISRLFQMETYQRDAARVELPALEWEPGCGAAPEDTRHLYEGKSAEAEAEIDRRERAAFGAMAEGRG